MMYRDGVRLWTDSPRNFILGVGMDSIKRYWLEWDLFDKGWQPMGHFHSTPLQLAVERGLPALLLWLWVLWLYARMLWRKLKSQTLSFDESSAIEKGILLGALGGLAGFFTSGLVHYNYGAAVVAMMFFIIMGLSVRLIVSDRSQEEGRGDRIVPRP
jgi:O-antigen ligase